MRFTMPFLVLALARASVGFGQEPPDGSVLAVYIHTGGHTTKDAQTEALWAIQLRVHPDRTGLDLLPAPGR